MLLELIQSFFSPRDGADGAYPQSVIEAAIELAVDGTDPRIRALGDYRERLRAPVTAALDHVVKLVDTLPSPARADVEGYRNDPCLRAMFSSAERLLEVLGRDRALDELLRSNAHRGPVVGVLAVAIREKRTLGMDLRDELIQRDVQQTIVSFDEHRVFDPHPEETRARRLLMRRAFDHILAQVLATMGERRTAPRAQDRRRLLLSRRLRTLEDAGWSLAPGVRGREIAALDRELADIDAHLADEAPRDGSALELNLGTLVRCLSEPTNWLRREDRVLPLDHRNVLRENDNGEGILVSELHDCRGQRIVVRLVSIDPGALPRPDFFKAASRFL